MRAQIAIVLALAASPACDAFLVGGECLEGWVEKDGACIVDSSQAGAGGAGGALSGAGGSASQGGGGGSVGGGVPSTSSAGGGGTGCGDLQACGTSCVDVESDPYHCGGCFVACATGICDSGSCVGGPAGHVVAVGVDFRTASQGSPVARILGNAVFLHAGNPLRIAGIAPSKSAGPPAYLKDLVVSEATLRNRAYSYAHVPSADLPARMGAGEIDVLVVLGSALGKASEVPQVAADLAGLLPAFFDGGGIVVAIPTRSTMTLTRTFLEGSGLLPELEMTHATGGELVVAQWTDALSVGLVSPLPLLGEPVAIAPADANAVTVLTSATGEPVALHRAIVGN